MAYIDGNMPLVRRGGVIHGGIDGYSRVITYLNCSNDNTADTVLLLILSLADSITGPDSILELLLH